VPRLALAVLTRPGEARGLLVVRVDLNREPVGAVEEFDEEGEARAVRVGHGAPEESGAVARGEFGHRQPGVLARAHAALGEGDPRLADGRVGGLQPLPAPDALAVLRLKRKESLRQSRHAPLREDER
jgi:hypothetical protein